jgi:hypothetical protein
MLQWLAGGKEIAGAESESIAPFCVTAPFTFRHRSQNVLRYTGAGAFIWLKTPPADVKFIPCNLFLQDLFT